MIRALLIEDDRNDADLMHAILVDHFRNRRQVVTQRVAREADLIVALEQEWGIAICDYLLPGFEWPRALYCVRRYSEELPFVLVSGVLADDKGLMAIRSGADEYLSKDQIGKLGEVAERLTRLNQAIMDHHRAAHSLNNALRAEGLTGL